MTDDPFQPETLIATGPAAKVYRGVETATGRKVLFKALLNEAESSCAYDREKLQLLAPMLLQLRHPQIAGLITLVPTEEEFALIYDFMPGMNARSFAASRQTSPADLRALAVQLMHALLVGEQLRQPHGDPKPSNLIIADHPGGGLFVQVQDWALSLTRTAHPPETRWFSAPELHAEARPSSQSDLFTAAASLFCLATNSTPAQADEAAELVQQWREFDAGHVLRHLRPDLDQPLIDWLAWLLRFDPQQRPQSIAQALDVLMPPMHPGFMPMQAPMMMPGTHTAPLVAAPAPTAAPAHPNAPKPKPITPKSPTRALNRPAAAKEAPPAAPAKSSKRNRVLIAVVLNLAALVLVGIFLWPFIQESLLGWKVTTDSGKDAPPAATAAVVPAATTATPPAVVKKSEGPAAPVPATGPGIKGRFVRLEIPGKAVMNLAEVQVFSGETNLAAKGTATQSSIDWDGRPELAIDGNTDGDKGQGNSVMHTDGKARTSPWWQVDLGTEAPLHAIVIWNRTDGGYGERSTNLTVKVLDAQQKVVWEKPALPKPDPRLTIKVGE